MGVFDALKTFQKDQGLLATGSARPDDETVRALNKEASKTPEGQYIWRTVEDDRVRKGHAEFNRTVRDWSDNPDPGEEFNCRCWAESLNAVALTQKITSEIYDLSNSWGNIEFIWYFYFGRGKDITLPQIGLLEPVIKHAERIMFDRVKSQVADKAKETGSGAFTGSWNNSYEFEDLVYSLGSVTIRGRFGGTVQKDGNVLNVQANTEYEFYDEFTDPISVRQLVLGTSEVATLPPSLLGGAVLLTTDLAGTPFRITGNWTTEITGSIELDKK